ncbi:MAG TPA: hypothetical protein VEV42_11775, partial [Pyrinomonadaceae bacterium]|nr:hypothetical protein [Pyrinomonadaceae bacterium]
KNVTIKCYKLNNLNSGASHLMPARLQERFSRKGAKTQRRNSFSTEVTREFLLIAVVLVMPAGVKAQTGRVALTVTVSETIALAVGPISSNGNVNTDVVSSGNTVRLTLSGSDSNVPVIRVPLLVRSNSGFRISAAFESTTAALAQLSITEVHPTGRLVSPGIGAELDVPRRLDLRGLDDSAASVLNPLDVSRPLLVLSGPRVSLGGTLNSPNNALQITLLIRLKPQPSRDWLVHLTFVGTAVSLTP